MKKIYVVTDEDYKMLRKVGTLENPCEKCGCNGCCGCKEGVEFDNIVRKYKENNLFEAMNSVSYINKAIEDIKTKINSINTHYTTLLEFGIDPCKIFDVKAKTGSQLIERTIRYGES